ncbi:hypothetical protein NKR23_g11586 [Pleurostoma richardsiae]|uniref:Uncharacterized protein n=1 Tax=Pleurostoma richardsiae TaxID=41990 RepID=A0AA38RJ20_9PEZI|nr:hypothetical protein NKR23_g11586 [Pleurostoma richardsiae]
MADEEQKASEEYSTNPNTMRARARKQKLQGEAKIQDAARTADYKAMLYARNSIREKPEYKAASDMAKQAMLEEAMRETMEKRRLKGQDTMSKMAAYHAGQYQYRAANKGPATRVPIMPFLKSNGYVPVASPMDAGPLALPGIPIGTNEATAASSPSGALVATDSDSAAALQDVATSARTIDGALAPGEAKGSPNFSPHNRRISLEGINRTDGARASTGPAVDSGFINLDTARTMPTTSESGAGEVRVENPSTQTDGGGGSSSSNHNQVIRRVGALHSAVERLAASGSGLRGDLDTVSAGLGGARTDVGLVRAELTLHKARADGLEERLGRLEGSMRNLVQVSIPRMQEQLVRLEEAVSELQRNIGGGADAEIARMRSVMRALQDALKNVGGY